MFRSILNSSSDRAETAGNEEMSKVIVQLCSDAFQDRVLSKPDSSEWHRLTDEILAYAKLFARLD